jgi:hypothetical protein
VNLELTSMTGDGEVRILLAPTGLAGRCAAVVGLNGGGLVGFHCCGSVLWCVNDGSHGSVGRISIAQLSLMQRVWERHLIWEVAKTCLQAKDHIVSKTCAEFAFRFSDASDCHQFERHDKT